MAYNFSQSLVNPSHSVLNVLAQGSFVDRVSMITLVLIYKVVPAIHVSIMLCMPSIKLVPSSKFGFSFFA